MSGLISGQFAKSLAGHDKDQIYVILNVERKQCILADGELKKTESPKTKNVKHVQPIHVYAAEMLGMTGQDTLNTNEQIKRAIKLYKKQVERL